MPDVINENGTWVIKQDSNLSELDLNVVDLADGSWNFIDVNGQVQTNTFSDGKNTLTLNAISAGNQNINTDNTYQGARWYRLLYYEDGTQVNSRDNFIFIATIQAHSSSNPSPFGLAIGTARNPLETGSVGVANQTFQHIGLANEKVTNNTGRSHEYDRYFKLAGGSTNANMTTASVMELTHKFSAGRNYGLLSVAANDIQGAANGSFYTASLPLFLQVGVITRFNTNEAISGAQHRHTLKYKIIKLKE